MYEPGDDWRINRLKVENAGYVTQAETYRRRASVAEAHLRGLIRRRDTGGDDLLADLVTLIDVARASLLLEGNADAQPPLG
jgi:hypothetical protein